MSGKDNSNILRASPLCAVRARNLTIAAFRQSFFLDTPRRYVLDIVHWDQLHDFQPANTADQLVSMVVSAVRNIFRCFLLFIIFLSVAVFVICSSTAAQCSESGERQCLVCVKSRELGSVHASPFTPTPNHLAPWLLADKGS
jgi:hypothetical protein